MVTRSVPVRDHQRRRLDELTDQLDQLSRRAAELLLARPSPAKPRQNPPN